MQVAAPVGEVELEIQLNDGIFWNGELVVIEDLPVQAISTLYLLELGRFECDKMPHNS